MYFYFKVMYLALMETRNPNNGEIIRIKNQTTQRFPQLIFDWKPQISVVAIDTLGSCRTTESGQLIEWIKAISRQQHYNKTISR